MSHLKKLILFIGIQEKGRREKRRKVKPYLSRFSHFCFVFDVVGGDFFEFMFYFRVKNFIFSMFSLKMKLKKFKIKLGWRKQILLEGVNLMKYHILKSSKEQ